MAQKGNAPQRKGRTAPPKKGKGKKEEDYDWRVKANEVTAASAGEDTAPPPLLPGGHMKPKKFWSSSFEKDKEREAEEREKAEQLQPTADAHPQDPENMPVPGDDQGMKQGFGGPINYSKRIEDRQGNTLSRIQAAMTDSPMQPTSEPEAHDAACELLSPLSCGNRPGSQKLPDDDPNCPLMPSPEKIAAAREEAEEEIREEHRHQAEEEIEHSTLRDNETAESLRGDEEVDCEAGMATSAEQNTRRLPQKGGAVLRIQGEVRERHESPMSTDSQDDEEVTGSKYDMDTDTSTAKAGDKQPPDGCMNMEIETASDFEDLRSSRGPAGDKREDATAWAPLEFEAGGGRKREKLGELDLAQLSSYRDLVVAIRKRSHGNIPSDGRIQLRYKDSLGDVMILNPDGQWSTFVAEARCIIISCK
eukprot:jgi/Botrbrau1/12507/Bobra.0169s0049.1